MAWSKIDLIRIKAYAVKVRNGMMIDDVPEKYREEVRIIMHKEDIHGNREL